MPEKFMVGGTGGSMVGWHMAQEEVWWGGEMTIQ